MQSEASFQNVVYVPASCPIVRFSFKLPSPSPTPPTAGMYQISHKDVATSCIAAHGLDSDLHHITEKISSEYFKDSPYDTPPTERQRTFQQHLSQSYATSSSSYELIEYDRARPKLSHRKGQTGHTRSSSSSSSGSGPNAIHVCKLSGFYATHTFSRADRRHIRAQQDREALWRRALHQSTLLPIKQ